MQSGALEAAERWAAAARLGVDPQAIRRLRRLAPRLGARAGDDGAIAARTAVALAPLTTTGGEESAALDALARAMAWARAEADGDMGLRAFVARARVLLRRGRFAEVEAARPEVERWLGRARDVEAQGHARVAVAHALAWTGQADISQAFLREAEAIAREEGLVLVAVLALAQRGFSALRAGDPAAALAMTVAAVREARAARVMRAVALARWAHGWVSAATGHLEEAGRSLEISARLQAVLSEPAPAAASWARVVEIARARGDAPAAERALDSALRMAARCPEARAAREVWAVAAVHLRGLGRTEASERWLDRLAWAEEWAAEPAAQALLPRAHARSAGLFRAELGLEDASWTYDPDGGRARRGSVLVDVRRRGAARRALSCLWAARGAQPGVPVSAAALARAAWPDGAGRPGNLHHLVWTLRKAGLGEALVTREDGYLLDPRRTVPVS